MLEIGSLVENKYKILSEIGHGGMSIVYMAINEKANKTWAVKEVRKDGSGDFEVVRQGLIVETEMLKKLSHPNLPSIVDVVDDRETLLIVMDYIEGNPLSRDLEEYGAQPQEYVIEWAKQLCDVLDYLHTRTPAIIYRDMKPANVMRKPDGNLTLIDFGTAREFKEKNLADTTCLGTIGYAAPEQFGGQGQTDARTDIYCLGATLYHLVTGCNPCEPPYEILPIRSINPALSGGLERIIEKCSQRNPDDRYQSCAELMYALEHYEEIDDLYKKKQKMRLAGFLATSFLTIAFTITAVSGYVSAENKLSENYDLKIIAAADVQLSRQERVDLYMDAIELNSADTKAYLSMLELFLSGDSENGSLTKDEASVITQLKAGVDVKSTSGYSSTIYPLDILKSKNASGYEEVCYEIGMAYWYDYEVESDRYTSAVMWFNEAVNQYPIAKTYVEIGECQQQIRKYAGQNRTEKMYEAYEELWEKLSILKTDVTELDDNDTKLLVWSEIIDIASEKAGYFLVNVQSSDMILLLDNIENDAGNLKDTTKYEDIKNIIDEILADIEMAKSRIGTAW